MANGFFALSTVAAAAPQRATPHCGACGLYRQCHTPKMPVAGRGKRGVLLVGDAPTKEDDTTGTPWANGGARHVAGLLRGHGWVLERDCFYTNALICRTKGGALPSAAEVGYCRPNLRSVIDELKPRVIVPMGKAAVCAVVGAVWPDVGELDRWVGWQIPFHANNAWVCPVWSPAQVLRSASDGKPDAVVGRMFERHIGAALALGSRPWPDSAPQYAQNVRIVRDPDEAARTLKQCARMRSGAVAWDYETDRLKPDAPDARIVSCAVAWGRGDTPDGCIAYPWHGSAIAATREFLRSPVAKIASNMKFEERWTRKLLGTRVRGWAWDTMLAAHVLDNRPDITSVKFQAFVRLGQPPWNAHIEPHLRASGASSKNNIARIDLDDLLLYNGLDAWLEYLVAVHQVGEMGVARPW